VQADIQLPCSEPIAPIGNRNREDGSVFRIAFAGNNVGTGDTLEILEDAIATGLFLPDGRALELHLYLPGGGLGPEQRRPNVIIHPWLSQPELERELAQADLLFLPYNFSPNYAWLWARSFPTKAAEYLRYGKPILLMAPPDAAIVPYARAHSFAAIVDRPDKDLLVDAIRQVATNVSYREMLSARALQAFQTNHDAARQRSAVYSLMDGLSRLSAPPGTAGNFRMFPRKF
jgi:glycosyltransferase involved in cell wall biosynthesis